MDGGRDARLLVAAVAGDERLERSRGPTESRLIERFAPSARFAREIGRGHRKTPPGVALVGTASPFRATDVLALVPG